MPLIGIGDDGNDWYCKKASGDLGLVKDIQGKEAFTVRMHTFVLGGP
jgi:hypothetical protein